LRMVFPRGCRSGREEPGKIPRQKNDQGPTKDKDIPPITHHKCGRGDHQSREIGMRRTAYKSISRGGGRVRELAKFCLGGFGKIGEMDEER